MLVKNLDSNFGIVQLIYCSYATNIAHKTGFERDLCDILGHNQAYNPLHEVTGALMTDGSMFVHVVEGPSAAVKDLYAKITRDKRHTRVLTLQYALTHVRLFGLWSIAFLRVGAMTYARTLDARSTPVELRKASIFTLQTLRPILLK